MGGEFAYELLLSAFLRYRSSSLLCKPSPAQRSSNSLTIRRATAYRCLASSISSVELIGRLARLASSAPAFSHKYRYFRTSFHSLQPTLTSASTVAYLLNFGGATYGSIMLTCCAGCWFRSSQSQSYHHAAEPQRSSERRSASCYTPHSPARYLGRPCRVFAVPEPAPDAALTGPES